MKVPGYLAKQTSKPQSGYALISATFVLLIAALAAASLAQVAGSQRTTVIKSLYGAQALQAAQAGLEWAVSKVQSGLACPATPAEFQLQEEGAREFDVTVRCESSVHFDNVQNQHVYFITAEAEFGELGQFDYVSRQRDTTWVQVQP